MHLEFVSPDDRCTEREIDPQFLFVDRSICYVVADDHQVNGYLRSDRLLSVAPPWNEWVLDRYAAAASVRAKDGG